MPSVSVELTVRDMRYHLKPTDTIIRVEHEVL